MTNASMYTPVFTDFTFCSTEYRFPVDNFQYCCQNVYKKDDPDIDPECNGEMINNVTPVSCCLNDAFIPCPDNPPCRLNKGSDLAFIHIHPKTDEAYMVPNERVIPTYPISGAEFQASLDITEGYLMCGGLGPRQDCHLLGRDDYQWHSWPGLDTIAYDGFGVQGTVVGGVPWLVGSGDITSNKPHTAYFDRDANGWVKGPDFPGYPHQSFFEHMLIPISNTQLIIAGGIGFVQTCFFYVYLLDTVTITMVPYPGGNLNFCRRSSGSFVFDAPHEERIVLIFAGASDSDGEHTPPEKSVIAKDGTFGPWTVDESFEILDPVTSPATVPDCRSKSGRHFCFFFQDEVNVYEFVPWQTPPWRLMAEKTVARNNLFDDGLFLLRV